MSRVSFMDAAEHYDRLDQFYRQLWGEHVHHGFWSDPTFSSEEAVIHLVHRVARDAHIGEGTDVWDIGCGYGAPARTWAAEYGARVTGFTVSERQYTYAEHRAGSDGNPEYRLQDVLENDLQNESMDAAVAIESISHIRDQPKVLREVARVLRSEGRFVGCVWMAAPSPPAWARRYLLEPICEEGRLSGLPTATDLRRWTTDVGLDVIRLDDVTPLVRQTWTVVLGRFVRALCTDPSLLRTLFDATESERVFARALPRIWLAQYLGVLRYGWLVAVRK